uniref:U2A'/phosphoprotein 32 family A C-terminal domain-containing protein n=1 Tax=Chromera velia CCMP2878 TaxID=1169474 RepID=A0A0G4F6R1_9ALVE|eukprot:Cvel_15361.t1-p1 / transcript=Cvel_15361.t1 / gene=Cvel_15361 / organism=Chromera_velia_CCMP2878 / gene_product=Leucine-rich repeat-containing protein 23, putative / transcript_product=Leucine-rich repeat-containing protein 23, putative / location=Cvel_scaffold1132:4014-7937(+) / protein_length=240 / sequence_SO=supercontig / SO=protein_coding / is_pseudo=false
MSSQDKGIQVVPEFLNEYKHLRYIDVSKNQIPDILPFTQLPHVISLAANTNALTTLEPFKEPCMPYCQVVNMSENQITKLGPIKLDRLTDLNLSKNEIAAVEEFDGHPTLQTLSLSGNKLKACDGIANMPVLKSLVMSENEINNTTALAELPELEVLDLSTNKLTTLDGFKGVPNITALHIKSLLLILERLTEINGELVTDEEREAAKELQETRRKEKEEAEAAAKAAEEAAANGEGGGE